MTRMSKKTTTCGSNGGMRTTSTWLLGTALMCGMTTFIVSDRFYHSLEVSQLLVVSIDTMNVGVIPPMTKQASRQTSPQQQDEGPILKLTSTKSPTAEPEPTTMLKNEKLPKEAASQVRQKHRRTQKTLEVASQETPASLARLGQITTGPKQRLTAPEVSPQDKQLMATVVRSLESTSQDDSGAGHKVYFLNETQVSQKDSFSASWIMTKKDFLDMNLQPVQQCEDAAFKAWNWRRHKLRMTMDYLDFSVEHLSKWWKVLDYDFANPLVWDMVATKLGTYIKNGATDYPAPSQDPPVFAQTFVTIAFQPYKPSGKHAKKETPMAWATNTTVIALAATIESLRRAEMGRVVVVGSEEEHRQYTIDAVKYLRENLAIHHSTDNQNMVGHLEVGFVLTTPEATKTNLLKRNMPRGCLVGAREAFLAADIPASQRTEEQKKHLADWFGTTYDPSHWRYLYLTEPDSVLTTRAEALLQIKEEMDLRGGIVPPFRLQPIPHESDVPGYKDVERILHEEDGFPVIEMDHYNTHDVCCDHHLGPDIRPGLSDFPGCGRRKWFFCGLELDDKPQIAAEDPHQRLRPYQLIRLKRGTGITTIAGNLFARRCFPAHNAVCKPPHIM